MTTATSSPMLRKVLDAKYPPWEIPKLRYPNNSLLSGTGLISSGSLGTNPVTVFHIIQGRTEAGVPPGLQATSLCLSLGPSACFHPSVHAQILPQPFSHKRTVRKKVRNQHPSLFVCLFIYSLHLCPAFPWHTKLKAAYNNHKWQTGQKWKPIKA